MIRKKIIESQYGIHKVYNTEPITKLKLWCTYLNSWGDRIFIAAQRADGLFVGYTYANPQPSLFTAEGAFAGYIDFNGVEHKGKRPQTFDSDFIECEFTPWRY